MNCPATGPWDVGNLACMRELNHPPGHVFTATAGADLSKEGGEGDE